MLDAGRTLKSILAIIAKDVRQIKKMYKGRVLDAETALTLSRYASTLNSVAEESKKRKERALRELSRKNTDELVRAYLEGKKKKEEKAP